MVEKPWYQMNEAEVCLFFDVDPKKGLTKKDALARLTRFGVNNDPTLSSPLLRLLGARVVRGSVIEKINVTQLAPGDIVVLEEGDRVPADIRLLHVKALAINQSMLTGEMLANQKFTYALSESVTLEHQRCMAFAGTYVTSGSGLGVVVNRANETAIAKAPKKRTPKTTLRNRALANKLERIGVVLLNQRILKNFKSISAVVIDAKLTDEQIIEIIRKVQLTKRILCKFIVDKATAEKLSKDLGVNYYDAAYPNADILNTQFIVNIDSATSVNLVSTLQGKGEKILWVTDGSKIWIGGRSANIMLAVGSKGRDDIKLGADMLAVKQDATIITQILHG